MNVSHFWMLILLCFSLLLFWVLQSGSSAWITRGLNPNALHNHWLIMLFISSARCSVMLKSYKTCWLQSAFLRNPITSSSIPSDAQISRSCPSQCLSCTRNKRKKGKLIVGFYNSIPSPTLPRLQTKRGELHTIELNKVKVENIKKQRLWSSVLLIGSEARIRWFLL